MIDIHATHRTPGASAKRPEAGGSSSWIIGGWIHFPRSDLDGIGRTVQRVHCELDIGPAVPRSRPAPGNKVPYVI